MSYSDLSSQADRPRKPKKTPDFDCVNYGFPSIDTIAGAYKASTEADDVVGLRNAAAMLTDVSRVQSAHMGYAFIYRSTADQPICSIAIEKPMLLAQ